MQSQKVVDALVNRLAAAGHANAAANYQDVRQIRLLRDMLESALNPLMHGSRQVLALQSLACLAALLHSHKAAEAVCTLPRRSAVLTSSGMFACNAKMTAMASL